MYQQHLQIQYETKNQPTLLFSPSLSTKSCQNFFNVSGRYCAVVGKQAAKFSYEIFLSVASSARSNSSTNVVARRSITAEVTGAGPRSFSVGWVAGTAAVAPLVLGRFIAISVWLDVLHSLATIKLRMFTIYANSVIN
jgi:hypothetical protein